MLGGPISLHTLRTALFTQLGFTHGRFERELGRKTYTTPTSYLELIKLYLDMLGAQRESVSTNESRYRNGLQKIEETKIMVNELQVCQGMPTQVQI